MMASMIRRGAPHCCRSLRFKDWWDSCARSNKKLIVLAGVGDCDTISQQLYGMHDHIFWISWETQVKITSQDLLLHHKKSSTNVERSIPYKQGRSGLFEAQNPLLKRWRDCPKQGFSPLPWLSWSLLSGKKKSVKKVRKLVKSCPAGMSRDFMSRAYSSHKTWCSM